MIVGYFVNFWFASTSGVGGDLSSSLIIVAMSSSSRETLGRPWGGVALIGTGVRWGSRRPAGYYSYIQKKSDVNLKFIT